MRTAVEPRRTGAFTVMILMKLFSCDILTYSSIIISPYYSTNAYVLNGDIRYALSE